MKIPFSAASHRLSSPKTSSSFDRSEPEKMTTVVFGSLQSLSTLAYTAGFTFVSACGKAGRLID